MEVTPAPALAAFGTVAAASSAAAGSVTGALDPMCAADAAGTAPALAETTALVTAEAGRQAVYGAKGQTSVTELVARDKEAGVALAPKGVLV